MQFASCRMPSYNAKVMHRTFGSLHVTLFISLRSVPFILFSSFCSLHSASAHPAHSSSSGAGSSKAIRVWRAAVRLCLNSIIDSDSELSAERKRKVV